MPTVYVQVRVAAADRAAAEADLSAFGSYPLDQPLCPYPGDPADPATHYGKNLSCVTGTGLYDALLAIPAAYPSGGAVQVVQLTSPYWKAFKPAVHWVGWLNAAGLQPQVTGGARSSE